MNSKKTFDFAIEHQGQNFNDLYERMDDHSFINNTTINDMNSLSKYFNNLFEKLQNRKRFAKFNIAIIFFHNFIKETIKEDI